MALFDDIPGSQSSENNAESDSLTILKEFKNEFHKFSKGTSDHYKFVEDYLKNAYGSKREEGFSTSAAFARQNAGSDYRNPFGRRTSRRFGESPFDRFTDSFESALFDGLVGSDLKKKIKDSLNKFAKELGTDIEHLPESFGDMLGKYASTALKNTKLGKWLNNKFTGFINNLTGNFGGSATGATQGASGVAGNLPALAGGESSTDFTALFDGLLGNVEGLADAFIALSPEILLAKGAIKFLSMGFDAAVSNFKSQLDKFSKTLIQISMRSSMTLQAYIEEEKTRIQEDIRTLIEEPFTILKEAAQDVYNVWDNQLRLINATQGYSKADLQDLMATFAQRIRDENLSAVVSGADIAENLAKVLESGLSGAVAEEFAYIATILNAAIPTQDFFEYGATYSSIAANLIASGKSQSEAISAANKELTAFANNILYANRELTGGFSTGLKNASDLFTQAVQITQAAKTGSPSDIAGVLTAVAGITGALAPDLASSMVDAVVKAATGGNASDIVALRSLAGINASNTEFLRALAQDPQKIFSTLFANLAEMQNMSNDAFMEVAEGLSSVFGVSMDAFARLDFNQLAKSIASMDMSSSALNQNMKMLISGQTTTTAEQLKMQQINQYLIEEGLAYVVDNEAARMIQEHMWNEQLAQRMIEAQYSVDLVAGSKSLFASLVGIGESILNVLTLGIKPAIEIANAGEEADIYRAQIGAMLIAGKVGSYQTASLADVYGKENVPYWMGEDREMFTPPELRQNIYDVKKPYLANDRFFKQLYVTGETFGLISSLPELIRTKNIVGEYGINSREYLASGIAQLAKTSASHPTSSYGWDTTISKSMAEALLTGGGRSLGEYTANLIKSATTSALTGLRSKVEATLTEDAISKYIGKGGGGYEAWKADISKNLISGDLGNTLESIGYAESEIEEYFRTAQANEAVKTEIARQETEDKFWSDSKTYQDNMTESVAIINETLSAISDITSNIYTSVGSIDDVSTKTDKFNESSNITLLSLSQSTDKSVSDILKSIGSDNENNIIKLLVSNNNNGDAIKEALTTNNDGNIYSLISSIADNLNSIALAFSTSSDTSITKKMDSIVNNTSSILLTIGKERDASKLTIMGSLESIYKKQIEFFDAWTKYFIEHEAYKSSYDFSSVAKVINDDKKESADAIQALADALIGAKNLDDPQVQTNALLAQILNTVISILAKQAGAMTFTIPDTLVGLSMNSGTV